MAEELNFDVAIVGGGPAGLNAALVLGRARKNVIVIDEEHPRNRVTHESHGFLSRDGVQPAELRRIAREQIEAYPSVQFVTDAAVAASGGDGDFTITTAKGTTYRSKKLLIATGMKDMPIDIDGLGEVYGTSAFVCPYCDGWELRDRQLALILNGPKTVHMAMMVSGWTDRIVICTNGPDGLTDEEREQLSSRNIPVWSSPIRRIESKEGMVERILLTDGTTVTCTGIFFAPKLAPGSELPEQLGCAMTEAGAVVADGQGRTNVAGVYVAGDAATDQYQVVRAAFMGASAAFGINGELLAQAWHSRM